MSGTASAIRATFINRSTMREYSPIPVASNFNLNTDMRKLSGTFEFEMEFSPSESFPCVSNDLVEFWYPKASGGRHQVGVWFLEDFDRSTSSSSFKIQANGRDLLGQLIYIPFRKQHLYEGIQLAQLARLATKGTYLADYIAFRKLAGTVVDLGAYGAPITVLTDQNKKRGQILEEISDLAINLVYQNRLGMIELYGRPSSVSAVMGKLVKASGRSNVEDISIKQNFSSVISECTVFYVAQEAMINAGSPNFASRLFKNQEPNAARINHPENEIFSTTDLAMLHQSAQTRIEQIAKSKIRKSNQHLLNAIVTVPDPFYTVPGSGLQIPFDKGQNWHIESLDDGVNQPMKLAGINYAEDAGHLQVQLAFVGVDTLI